ncbi:MAG: hypothetical protein IPH42_04670 [Bacteroidetes bacterium]|jgi:hypothetical protein|nr:hypothetical protein [Bacteroidota bacterium]MBP8894152.1 hypothetical protein [Saprospiraceae bacterium]
MELTVETNTLGNQEINFGNNHNATSFYQFAARLEKILAIKYTKKHDYFNTITWDYMYRDVKFKLVYDWHEGIFISLVNKQEATEQERIIFESLTSILQRFN